MRKSFIGSGSWKYTCVLALGLLASGGASADPVVTSVACDEDTCWQIGAPGSGRVEAVVGEWIKNLDGRPNTTTDSPSLLDEYLKLTSGSITSWTEVILSDFWVWDDTAINMFSWGGAYAGSVLGVISDGGKKITFSGIIGADTNALVVEDDPPFNLVPQGGPIDITINKNLICRDGDDETCPLPFTVVENSVPEPGTLLLLAAGLAGFGLRRRRNA